MSILISLLYFRFCGDDYKKTTWTKNNTLLINFLSGLSHEVLGSGFNATIKIMRGTSTFSYAPFLKDVAVVKIPSFRYRDNSVHFA